MTTTILRSIVYVLVVLGAGTAIVGTYLKNPIAENELIFTFLQLGGILFIGCQHIKITNALRLTTISPNTPKGLVFTFFLAITLFFSVWGLKYFGITTQLLMPLIAAAAFFLPSVLYCSYNAFRHIPDIQVKPWYKRDNLIENTSFVFLSTIPLQIKLQATVLDSNYTHFNCTVPGQYELGKIFHYFLIQQQINQVLIDMQDEDGEPYGWNFYLERKWFPLVAIHPEKSLLENRITADTAIIAKRVILPPEISFQPTNKNLFHELH